LLTGIQAGGPSEKAPVINFSLSSDEEGLLSDVSHDFEFTQQLYGELNHDLLGPPGDSKIIILSDSNEGKVEDCEENSTSTEDAAASATINPASTASTDADDAPSGAKNDNSDDHGPDQEASSGNDSEDDAGEP
jgi:hypothetical protein